MRKPFQGSVPKAVIDDLEAALHKAVEVEGKYIKEALNGPFYDPVCQYQDEKTEQAVIWKTNRLYNTCLYQEEARTRATLRWAVDRLRHYVFVPESFQWLFLGDDEESHERLVITLLGREAREAGHPPRWWKKHLHKPREWFNATRVKLIAKLREQTGETPKGRPGRKAIFSDDLVNRAWQLRRQTPRVTWKDIMKICRNEFPEEAKNLRVDWRTFKDRISRKKGAK